MKSIIFFHSACFSGRAKEGAWAGRPEQGGYHCAYNNVFKYFKSVVLVGWMDIVIYQPGLIS